MSKPEFTRPSVGDELIILEPEMRRQPRTETPVRVIAVARFRIVLEGADGEPLPWDQREFDVRTQRVWTTSRSDRLSSGYRGSPELHTAETLAYRDRMNMVNEFLREHGLRDYELRGSLRKAYEADPVEFVNVLLRFAGEEEIS